MRSQNEREKAMAVKILNNSLYGDKEPGINNRMPDFDIKHVQVYMDIQIGTEGQEGYQKSRIVMELFKD